MRYQCVDLGHTEKLIQEKLDKLPPGQRLLTVVWIGTSMIGILEPEPVDNKKMVLKK